MKLLNLNKKPILNFNSFSDKEEEIKQKSQKPFFEQREKKKEITLKKINYINNFFLVFFF